MHHYLVCYDIVDEKRLKKVYKLCKNFGNRVQYSVFLCRLTDENLTIFKDRLIPIINKKEDQVLFVRIMESEKGAIQKNTISIIGKQIEQEIPLCWIFS